MKKLTFLTAQACVLLLMMTTLFVTACSNDKQQINALDKERETIHNAAMKDLADMNRVAGELKNTLIASTMTPEQSAPYAEVLTNMGNAENQMMEVMKNYKKLDELNEMKPEEVLKYLQDQKISIEKNHAEIKAALEAGLKLQGK